MLLTRKKRFSETRLVLAIDIGTTYTAVSYCIMNNEENIKFQEINKWPKQSVPDAKIPSVVFYDEKGYAQIFGAETEDEAALLEAEEKGWRRVAWWKLALRPGYYDLPSGMTIPELPAGLTVDDIFQDQFRYVMENVRKFIIRMHTNGETLWKELFNSMHVILTTPNGWEGRDQQRMRVAAVKAGIISENHMNRVRFVSESEAGIHYCLQNVKRHTVAVESTVIVCDAGGGTTDIGIYRVRNVCPIHLEEVLAPSCFIAGGTHVNQAAEKVITSRLKGSKYSTKEYLANIMRVFENQVKRCFKGTEAVSFIPLDGSGESDEARGITRGRLKITKSEMLKFYEAPLNRVKTGLQQVLDECPLDIHQFFIIGGFAESEYVYSEISKVVQARKIAVGKPDDVLSKAIAHGALSWHVNSGVQLHIARLHYGAETDLLFDTKDPDMHKRKTFKNSLGESRVRDGWSSIVGKGARLRTGGEHASWFHHNFEEAESLIIEMELYAYRYQKPPRFIRDINGSLNEGFIHIGKVQGDLTKCFESTAAWKTNKAGKQYKTLQYEVCLLFDEIEVKACLRWKQNNYGNAVRGEATIIYDI